MEEKKTKKIRIFDIVIVLIIAYLCFLVFTIKTENNELNAKLANKESAVENSMAIAKVENKVESKSTSAALPTSDASLEERVAYLEKRLQEDTYADSNYSIQIAEYIDSVAMLAASGENEEQEIRDIIQNYMDKTDAKASETSTGHSHIVLSVERNQDGSFTAHTYFREEQSREPVDFKVTLDGRGNVLSCDYIEN